MLSKLPIDLDEVSDEDREKQILRAGLIAELDAINLYEQMAALSKKPLIKNVLLDVAEEEKEHVGEFLALLLEEDEEQEEELEEGREEVEEERKELEEDDD